MPRPPPANRKQTPACHDHGDCQPSACCDRGTGQCISRSHPHANSETGCNLLRMKGRYPDPWAMQPGTRGFSNYVHGLLLGAHIPRTLTCDHTDPKDNWYQAVLSYLVHPRSPVQRLLVCWQLGTGKTIGMLRVLDNYFDDPRPKILVFPTRALVANFYEELARQPNRYRQWAVDSPAQWRWPTTGLAAQAQAVDALKKTLEFGTTKSALAGPLRAFSYTQVGGQTLINYTNTTRQRAITAAIGGRRDGSPLDGTVVLCDEAHNILYPPSDLTVVQLKLVATFRDRLYRARDAVVVLFTATPVLRQAADARTMLDLVKGQGNAQTECDEGFVSWYMDRPPALFARLLPEGVGRDLRKAVVGVYLDSHPAFWRVYVRRRYGGGPAHTKDPAKKVPSKASTYNHACVDAHNPSKRPCLRTLGRYEHVAFGRPKDEVLVNRKTGSELAPKLEAIAQSVADHNLRTVILIHRENGCVALLRLLRQHGLDPIFLDRVTGETVAVIRQRERENREAIQQFNQSVHPDAHRVLVAVSEEYSEGVSFLNVRRIILADLSSGVERPSWSSVKQRMGRALRACSHDALPRELRTMWISLFVAVHRQPEYARTIDEEKLELVLAEMETIEAAMAQLRDASVDAAYFATSEPRREVGWMGWNRFTDYFTLTE